MRAVTVRAVSEAAGVGMGTLRHHFASQRDLFAELVADVVDDRLDDANVFDTSRSGPQRLQQALGQFLPAEYADTSTLSGWFDVYATAFAQPPSEHSRQLLDAAARRSHRHVRAWLVQLASEGWVDAAAIDETANLLIALSSGLLLETLTPASPVTFDTARSTLSAAARAVAREAPVPLGALADAARGRFLAPVTTLPVTARKRADRAIVVSNETGTFQIHAWDRERDVRWQLTDATHGAVLSGLSPDGRTVWWFSDVAGDEVGQWQTAPFPRDPASTPVARPAPDVERGMSLGHAIGDRRTVLGLATDEGSTVWVVEDVQGTPRGRRLLTDSGLVTVHAMDAAEELVAVGRTVDGDALHPQAVVVRIADGVEVARIWDGPDSGLEIGGFAPLEGDMRLLMTHERGGYRRPFIWSVDTGERTELELGLNGEAWARWYPDGTALLIAHTERGRSRLHRYVIATGHLEPLRTPPGWIGAGAVRADGAVEYLWCDAAHPFQHRLLSVDGTDRDLTRATDQGAPSQPLEDVFIPLDDEPGESLHVLYATPEGGSLPRPTVFLVHGGPYAADEDFYSPARAAWLDAGFAVVHVNYRGSTGYGRRWRDSIIGDPGRRAVADIARAHAWAIDAGLAHPARCIVEGWSWGGYLALLAAGLHPDAWAACIAGAPIADYTKAYEEEPEPLRAFDRALFGGSPAELPEIYAVSSPSTYAPEVGCPILILHGVNDPRSPAAQLASFARQLSTSGKPHEIYEFSAGHGSLDTAETIRQLETEIGFALRHLLPTFAHGDPAAPDASPRRRAQRS